LEWRPGRWVKHPIAPTRFHALFSHRDGQS
jgi:hypothetical protein